MKVIIAGSRDIEDYELVESAIMESGFDIDEVVSGMARGVDLIGRQWAKNNHIPCVEMPADWEKFGKGAGQERNRRMARYADALIAVWDGSSRGTHHMIRVAKMRGMKSFVKKV